MAIAENFHLETIADPQLLALCQRVAQPFARQFDGHTPANHALFEQNTQRVGVITIQGRAGDEGKLLFIRQLYRAEIVASRRNSPLSR